MRVFYNKKKQPLLYYFDITNKQGLDNDTGIPYYIDICNDIMIYTNDNKIVVVDEDELKEALKNKEISKVEYNKANKFKNTDFTKLLR